MASDENPSYFLDDKFSQRAHQWAALLARVLPQVNYLELNKFLLQGPLPDMLQEAAVELPQQVTRAYGATHRFWLTPALRAYCQTLAYDDWRAGDFEDPAFYHDDQLLLGTISHEDYVMLQLHETEKALLNEQGFNFWCQWWPA
ncbi:hypothetical protein J7E24_13975 [Hymenobacter sp. ISL-91]|uniref:hypothetical protein n=1 Tax=Hymenobacter sp. ISL-91 TaxID=2819151 RepID=UPI001BE6C463|nr:hypothetical protein [Hymenobacter sp. ISL-91]MBT2558899.1 hypothetical protein [Hymenobacter sp. ISL-91]